MTVHCADFERNAGFSPIDFRIVQRGRPAIAFLEDWIESRRSEVNMFRHDHSSAALPVLVCTVNDLDIGQHIDFRPSGGSSFLNGFHLLASEHHRFPNSVTEMI